MLINELEFVEDVLVNGNAEYGITNNDIISDEHFELLFENA